MTTVSAARRRPRSMAGALLAVATMMAALVPGAASADAIAVSGWGTSMMGIPFAVAMEKKFFDQSGIHVDEISGGGGGEVVRNAMASDLPYGEVALSSALAAYRQGLPIIIVETGTIGVNNVWLVQHEAPIKTFKDLVGKRVAYTIPKSISETLLLLVLQHEHIDEGAITKVAAGGYVQGLTLLSQGAVDAAPLSEPLLSINAGKYRTLLKAQDVLPDMAETVGITRSDFAARHPDKLRAIIEGRRMAVDYIYAHPDEAARITARTYDMDPAIMIRAVESNAKVRQWVDGEMKRAQFDAIANGMRLTGEITGDVPWDKLLDTSFLPPDLKAKSD